MMLKSQKKISQTIKLILYKEDHLLFEKVHYENDAAFLEPLLFSYFNSKKENLFPKEILKEILQGFYITKEPVKIKYSYNKDGVAYIPEVGYFKNGALNPFEDIVIITNTNIELINHKIIHLNHIFRDFSENIIDSDLIEISNTLNNLFIKKLENAFLYIKENCFSHYKLIEQCCKKIVLFKTNPENTNSFATINAHGIAFLNVYQDNYDEVFFVDDIAHQTGHIILTTFFFERKKHFIINENQNLGSILNDKKEYRSFYILFHALYTYYTTFLCLDNCIDSNCFNKKQSIEAKARIGFYLNKCKSDLINFSKVIKFYGGIDKVISEDSTQLFETIKNKYFEIEEKWRPVIKKFNYGKQPYNFTFDKFLILNPIHT